ncbi:hypothetical protein LA080_008050 [Diaporthe eres]|nr:hypothetical protein LA080_008050 [Diaporthe eres]
MFWQFFVLYPTSPDQWLQSLTDGAWGRSRVPPSSSRAGGRLLPREMFPRHQGLTEMGSTGPQTAWTMNLWTRREIREDVSMQPRAGRHMLWPSPSCSIPNRDIAAESEMPDSDNGLAMRPKSKGARGALLRLNDSPRDHAQHIYQPTIVACGVCHYRGTGICHVSAPVSLK